MKPYNLKNLKKILNFHNLTEQQKQLVFYEKTPILVSASAGSGKTFSLCCRILFKLLNPEKPLDASDLLVVSFTKAAAEEIYSRLKIKINSLIQQFPKEAILKKQLNFLSQNNVTTIDSFCSNFLKDNFEAAKISPNFKIGNEIEFLEIKQQILENIFEKEKNKNLEKFQKLSNYFSIKSEEGLKNAVLKIVEKSRTNPFPEQFLINMLNSYKKPKPITKNINLTNQIAQEITDRINTATVLLINSIDYMDDLVLKKSFEPIVKQNTANLNYLLEKLENSNYENYYKHIANFEFEPVPRYSKKTNDFDKNLAEFIKTKFLNPAKKLVSSTTDLLINNEQFLQDQKEQKSVIYNLVNLCFIFSKKLNEHKKLTQTLEFSDLILKTIKLLTKPLKNNKFKLTELGENIKNRFKEVLIDEFQDINRTQELLFKILSNNNENLVAIGDLKQSIYRFRQADPEIFLNYRKKFKEQNRTIIELKNNFRSHCEITNSINFLFGQLMSNQFGGIDYAESDTLISSSNFKPTENYFTEFHILTKPDEPLNSVEFEMKHVACQINNLIQNKFKFIENGREILCEPKHFAVLLRSEKQARKILCEELTKFKIPFCVDETSELLAIYEINIVIAMLKIINNPLDDVAFCAVAKSPIFNFSNIELAKIKADCNYKPFFLAFNEAKLKKCDEFLKILFEFGQKLQIMPLSQLVQSFYNLESFNGLIFNSGNSPKQNLANLNAFLNLINELEQNNNELNLNTLLNMLQTAKTSNLNLNTKTNLNFNQQNGVKILTIHKSKGLEFPIVFVPMCSKKFNKQDFNIPIVVSNKFGLGLKHSKPEKLTRYNTLNFNSILFSEQNEAKAEELRLLYVAMTRAQQKLIMVATDTNKKFKSNPTPNSKVLPPSFCRTKNSFYEWLLAGFMRHKNSFFNRTKVEFDEPEFECNIIIKNKFDYSLINETKTKELNPKLVQTFVDQIKSGLKFKIKTNELSKIPAKISVSELSKPQSLISNFKKLSFSENEQTTFAEIGTAMHQFLQHANFNNAKQNLKEEINRLILKEFISKKQAKLLNLNQLYGFFNSQIFNMVKTATSIEREKNLIFEIPANKINKQADQTPIIVQGTIDLIIKHDDKTTIVDYKTDKTTNQNLKLRYEKQLKIYKYALEQLSKHRVDSCLIYSLYSDSIIEID